MLNPIMQHFIGDAYKKVYGNYKDAYIITIFTCIETKQL